MKKFYIAHARGCNFNKLRDKGFVTLFPAVDDYVFLEDIPRNQKHLRKQAELGIHFLKTKKGYVTATESEINRMKERAKDELGVGAEILAVSGVATNLDGVVLEVDGTRVKCRFNGYNRMYEVWTDRQDIVPNPNAKAEPNGTDPSS